ncbi:MAG TPA: LuxR C-terminal-related transcriptional regulator [Kineosporiaceae bacterium]|nr:LuxR C-terminal-related transcriptional regulator [Kineosporiaceae bacterium]
MRAVAGNLPQELTSFVGRRRELSEVKQLLAQSRLVTLAGVGGVGKTRLALRVAAGLHRKFGAGVWLVELDQVLDAGLVAHAVGRALGLREQPGLPRAATLSEYLADRQVLLVLDNCEHLVGGVAKLVETLLRDTSQLRILATSREPLHVEGETVHPVGSLKAPDQTRAMRSAELAGYEAVTLFTERAQAVLAGFELTPTNQAVVGEICSRLDGLPLAIELAVARLRVLAPEQIRDRLADRALLTRGLRTAPARQQTLWECLKWSHDLCVPAEQLVWARLSVFAGDFDLAAADGVCADDQLPADSVQELIELLADKSILTRTQDQAGAVAYRMLETIRSYGREQLAEIGEEALARRRHRDWHQQLAARFQADWIGPRQRDWLRRLDRTLPDLWAAVEFSLDDPGQPDAALAMVGDLQMYFTVSGLQNQERSWLNRALSRPGPPSSARLRALVYEAMLAGAVGDVPAAGDRAAQAREIAGRLDDAHSHALATAAEGMLAIVRGDTEVAVRLSMAALDMFRAQDDVFWQALSLGNLTLTKVLVDDMAGAAACHQAMLAICEPTAESFHSGFTGMSLGIGLWREGDLSAAVTQMTESLRLIRRTGDTLTSSWGLEVTAWIAAGREEPRRAATLLGAATALADTMGTRAANWPDLLTYHEQCQQQVRRVLGGQAFGAAFEHGYNLSLDEAIGYALGEQSEHLANDRVRGNSALSALTRREREVAGLVAEGLTNREIAERLVVSPRTVEGHMDNIMRKLECASRAQVAALFVRMSPSADPGAS